MKFRAVTTCNAEGWEQTGRRMAESFVQHWQGVELTVYAEGFVPDVDGVRVAQLPAWLDAFKARHRDNADAHGRERGDYNYRRDCVRFAHKVGAITDAAETRDGVLIWLDADTLSFDAVTEDWLASLLPHPAYISWLARPGTYPECGFLMLDTEAAHHSEVMARLTATYCTDRVLALPETHDSYVIQRVIERAAAGGWIWPPHNLSGPQSRRGHPWLGSALATRLDHLKGKRKALGRTPKAERLVRDGNAYWR